MRLRCRMREVRTFERKGLREVAEQAGINRGTLSFIEQGRLLPLDEQIPALEQAYGRPIEQLYSPLALRACQEDDA
jgi:transcriptional regulator with XRE-family HTH domain